MHGANLGDLLVVFIKRLAVFPVVESGDAHDFFLLVDNRQGQDVLDDEACLVHGLFLKDTEMKCFKSLLYDCMTSNLHYVLESSACICMSKSIYIYM